jgi:TP901 family phage tail tape measure protein
VADRTVTVRLRAYVGDFRTGLASAGKSVDELQGKLAATDAKAKQNVKSVSRGMLLIGGAALAGVGVAVKQFAEFDKAMSNVKAVSGATAGQLGELRDAAIQAGAATVFNAKDAADAEGELAKAGVHVKDILAGGLTGALNLAAAGQIGVADAANIAATAMVQFGKTGADVPHIADLLAAAANKAQGGVQDMATALKYVGPIAHQMGISLEETTGTIAELANNGILADQAGTDLRGVLSSLTSPSRIAAKEMQALGINVYDAQGNFVGFSGVAQQLQQHLGTLTNAERDQALGRIFGNAQITAARILYAGGAADVNKWTKAVNDDGAAARIAHTNLDNLAGDFEQLKGSLQTLLIQSGSSANVPLRKLTETATGTVNAISNLPGPVQQAGTALVAVGGGATFALGALGYLVPKIKQGRDALESLGTAGQFANKGIGVLGTVGKYAAGITAAVIAVTALNDAMRHGPTGVNTTTKALLAFGDTGTDAKLKQMGLSLADIDQSVERIVNPSHVARTRDFFNSFVGGSGDLNDAKDKVGSLDAALAQLVSTGHGPEAEALFQRLADHGAKFGVTTADLNRALPKYQDALDGVATSSKLAGDGTGGLTDGLGGVDSAAQQAADAITAYKTALDNLNGLNISAAQSRLALKKAEIDAHKAIKDSTKVTDDEKSALYDLASQANDTAKAIADQTGDTDKANASMRSARKSFIATAEAMGYSHGKAVALANAFLAIPTKRSTTYTTIGLDGAIAEADLLRRQLLAIPSHRSVSVTITTANHLANIPIDGAPHRAGGGWTPPGTYWVGERGPELFTTAVPGMVTPAHATSAVLAHGGPLTAANSAQGSAIMRDLIVYTREDGRVVEDIPRALDAQAYRMRGR